MLVKRCNIYANIKTKSAILRLHTVLTGFIVFSMLNCQHIIRKSVILLLTEIMTLQSKKIVKTQFLVNIRNKD